MAALLNKDTLVTVGGNLLLNYGVPFAVQMGFGAGTGPALSRTLVAGTALTAAELAMYFGSGYITSPSVAHSLDISLPLISGGIYAITQSMGDFSSQGMSKDFTFATVSAYTSWGLSGPFSELMSMFGLRRSFVHITKGGMSEDQARRRAEETLDIRGITDPALREEYIGLAVRGVSDPAGVRSYGLAMSAARENAARGL